MTPITSIESLTSLDIRRMAQAAYQAHQQISDCPTELTAEQTATWRMEFIAMERQDEDALV